MERIELGASNDMVAGMPASHAAPQAGTSMAILQSLLCLLREKNLLTRADIEDLCDRVQARAADCEHDPLPCCAEGKQAAATEMDRLKEYMGRFYGGKHRRSL
jgi:hypothetical protein